MLDKEKKTEAENPYDAKYKLLNNDLDSLEPSSEEYKRIQTFLNNTMQHYKLKLIHAYSLGRHGDDQKFKRFDKMEHRKLLWHGSKVAVFASILSTGLRIMPHSGGRVGRGLYFADIIGKSASYCGLHNNIGLVLLNEVALGKINEITMDDSSLVKPPAGYDSVRACGTIQPDDKNDWKDTKLSQSGHPVVWPLGKIGNTGAKSSFMHNEYLVYDQEQVNMKYLLMLQWG